MPSAEKPAIPDSSVRNAMRSLATLEGALVGLAIVGAWTVFLLQALANFDVFGFLHTVKPGRDDLSYQTKYLVTAIALTVLAPIVTIRLLNKSRDLAARGITVQGTIISRSGLRRNGMGPVSISFLAGGVQQIVRKDVPLKYYADGDPITIVYDPQKPRRCSIKANKGLLD